MSGVITLSDQGIYEGMLEAGMRLADMPESEGGWSEYSFRITRLRKSKTRSKVPWTKRLRKFRSWSNIVTC